MEGVSRFFGEVGVGNSIGLGIRLKLLIPILIMAGACLAFVQFVWLPAQIEAQHRDLRKIELDALNVLHLIISDAIAHGEIDRLAALLDHAKLDRPDWLALRYIDNDAQQIYPVSRVTFPSGANIIQIERVVDYEGTIFGVLYAFVDIGTAEAEVAAKLVHVELSFAVIFLLATIASLIVQNRLIRLPLLNLAQAAQRMAQGDYSMRLPAPSRDEVGSLTTSFDLMRNNLQQVQGRLAEKARQAEQALDELVSHKFALDQHAIVAVTDPQGRIDYVNDKFCQISQYSREELIGCTHAIVNSGLHPKVFFDQLWRTISSGQVWHGEICNRAKDGSLYWVESTIVPFTNSSGNITQYIGIRTDITERKQAETELEQAKQQAETANQTKSAFLANMSHEIRTPMNGVLGMLNLLQQSGLANEQSEFADTAVRSAEALLVLLNDILDLSKIEAGHMRLESIDFDLRVLVEDVVNLQATTAQKKDLSIACLIGAEVPDRVQGDPTRLRQVLNNLVSNAIKFTSQGEVLVQVSMEHTAKVELFDDDNVDDVHQDSGTEITLHFSVSDTGIGIRDDQIDAIFTAFTQADGSITRRFGGTGLGLSICRRLVNAMGGEISVQNNGDRPGSTFRVSVRLQPASEGGSVWMSSVGLAAKRVLIIDDNGTNRMVLQHYLSAWGVVHDSVENAEQAIQRHSQSSSSDRPFDCILIGHRLPEFDGMAQAAHIMAAPELKGARLMILSFNAQRGEMLDASRAGVQGYLSLPVRSRELHDTLAMVLGLTPDDGEVMVTRHVLSEVKQYQLARILVVEDNKVNQAVVVAMLKKMGLRADVAANGQEALEVLAQREYDLILMDMQMPVMDGLEATRQIRLRENGKHHIPVIAMTANVMPEDQASCLAAGMDDFVAKPIHPELFQQSLNRWLVTSPSGSDSLGRYIDFSGVAVLDQARMEEMERALGGSVAFIRECYMRDTLERLRVLREAVSTKDRNRLRETSNSLAISSSNIGARLVYERSLSLEQQSDIIAWDEAESTIESIADAFASVEKILAHQSCLS